MKASSRHFLSANLSDTASNMIDVQARTTSLAIFGISATIATRVAIEPSEIETFEAVEKFEVDDPEKIAALYAAFERSAPKPSAGGAEYRWKVVAFDPGGTRIYEIYASPIALYGMTGDGTSLHFANDSFTKYLAAHYAVTPTLEELGLA